MTTIFGSTRLLYLDFDGVLHPEDVYRRPQVGPCLGASALAGHVLFEHAMQLAELPRRTLMSASCSAQHGFAIWDTAQQVEGCLPVSRSA